MRITQVAIKKKADLERVLGGNVAKTVLTFRDGSLMQRLPRSIEFHDSKPAFCLNDGDTLQGYGIDIETGQILGSHYCGSTDTALHHLAEQFSEGAEVPGNKALVFVQEYWNGRNMSWNVTVVSPNVQKEIA